MKPIVLLLILISMPVHAYQTEPQLLEQNLNPVIINQMTDSKIQTGRTYSQHDQARALAPKIKSYPFLDQLEFLIYPGRDFKLENPGKRLVRLETAVFGDEQSGAIPQRLSRLKDEITSWQIANMQAMEIVSANKKQEAAFQSPKPEARGSKLAQVEYQPKAYYQPLPNPYSPPNPTTKRVDYDYMNYRATTPIVQSIARKAIEVMFQ